VKFYLPWCNGNMWGLLVYGHRSTLYNIIYSWGPVMVVIILDSTLYDKDFQSVTCDRLVVFSRYSRFLHDVTEILLKVALNPITPLYNCLLNFFQENLKRKNMLQKNNYCAKRQKMLDKWKIPVDYRGTCFPLLIYKTLNSQ
jgi:hypothetical protein